MFIEFESVDFKNFPDKLKKLLEEQSKKIDKLIESESYNYQDIVKPLEDLEEERELIFTPVSHLNSVLNSDESQKAYEKSIPILSKFYSELGQNEKLYLKLKKIESENSSRKKVLENSIREFKLSGAELEKDKKDRLKDINRELSELSNSFSQNLINATNSFEMIVDNFEDVKELPKSDLESAEFKENGITKWRFTLQMPSYLSYMKYGTNRSLREKIYKAYVTRAPENGQIIDKILSLRFEKAGILGYKNYAEYALESRDAESEEDVLNFLWKLTKLSKNRAKNELKELENFAKKLDGIEKLESYDLSYYSEKMKKSRFNFDENETNRTLIVIKF